MSTLVCFMGRHPYKNKRYQFERKVSGHVDYPPLALIEFLQPGHVVVLVTDDSEVRGNFELFREEVTKQWPSITVEEIRIPVARTADDFSAYPDLLRSVGSLSAGDVVLDITLGLRSNSIAMLLGGSYLDALGGMRLSRVVYANVEAARDESIAEIIDLTPLMQLPRLAAAVRDLEAGNLSRFMSAVAEVVQHDVDLAKQIQNLANRLEFVQATQLMSKSGQVRIRRICDSLRGHGARVPAFAALADRACEHLGELLPQPGEPADSPLRLPRLVQWYMKRGQHDRALLFMVEEVLQTCREATAIELGSRRETVQAANSILINSNRSRAAQFLQAFEAKAPELRHSVAHAGRTEVQIPATVKKDIESLAETFLQFCQEMTPESMAPT